MIDHDVMRRAWGLCADRYSIPFGRFGAISPISGPDRDVLHKDVVGLYLKSGVNEGDARRGRGLTGDRDKGRRDLYWSGELNNSPDLKDAGARTSSLGAGPEAPSAAIGKV